MDEAERPDPARRPDRAPGWLERLAARTRETGASLLPSRKAAAPRPSVAVVADSASAVPRRWAEEHDSVLRVVAMPVMIDGRIYTEGLDDIQTELALALAMGRTVQTSRPAPGLLLRAYRELAAAGASEIVSIHLSSALSGTVDAARLAAAESPVPVRVVDSRTVGLAQGLAVIDAVEAAARGASAQEVADVAAAAAAANTISFVVPSLEQLRRGGRIGNAAAVLGSLLAVKPILAVEDGQIVVQEKVRTLPKAVARLVATARQRAEGLPGGARICVQYFGNEEQALELVHELGPAASGAVLCEAVPAVLAAHTGAGVLAVVVGRAGPPVLHTLPGEAAVHKEGS